MHLYGVKGYKYNSMETTIKVRRYHVAGQAEIRMGAVPVWNPTDFCEHRHTSRSAAAACARIRKLPIVARIVNTIVHDDEGNVLENSFRISAVHDDPLRSADRLGGGTRA